MESPTVMYDNMLWGVRRSIRYHGRRRSFFETFNLTANAIALIFGSATIAAVVTKLSESSQIFWLAIGSAAIITIFSSLNLVIGTVQKAQRHHDLVRRFSELERDLIRMDTVDDKMIREAVAKRIEIEADEPPIWRVIDILCHNELMTAQGYDPSTYPDHYYKVGMFRRLLSPICDFGADNIKRIPSPKSATC